MHDGHDHHHSHGASKEAGEDLALLTYMLDHNRHHADELHELAHDLSDTGKADAAALLHEALDAYNTGNEKLAQALEAAKK